MINEKKIAGFKRIARCPFYHCGPFLKKDIIELCDLALKGLKKSKRKVRR